MKLLTLTNRISLALALLGAAGCTYGPIRQRARIDDALPHPATRLFVAIVRHEEFREPTGLAAFPDGGSTRILRQWLEFYIGNVDDGSVRLAASMSAPDDVWRSLGSVLSGWRADTAYAVLYGCPRTGDCAKTRRLSVRIDPDGRVTGVPSAPSDLERRPNMLARAVGEPNYTRLSAANDTLKGRVADGAEFLPLYVLNERGALRAVAQ